MRAVSIAILVLGLALGGCNKADEAEYGTNPKPQGRYAGIGTFEAGRMWNQAAGAVAPKDPATAKLEDDEHVIVVIDTRTGEVRQCGDHSGVCVAMNPWTSAGGLTAPVALKKHAAELDAEQQASEAGSEASTTSAH
jgi:hypothetical protein